MYLNAVLRNNRFAAVQRMLDNSCSLNLSQAGSRHDNNINDACSQTQLCARDLEQAPRNTAAQCLMSHPRYRG
eukprot:3226808-Amphidinium_carterae.1